MLYLKRVRKKQKEAERAGFEPAVQGNPPYDGLANRCLQPLGHLSGQQRNFTISEMIIQSD